MNDLEFAALLVSRVCHDLVSPVGAVVNGLELLEEERDTALRADALKLVASSAALAAARLQFARIAFGAAGSSGAELDLTEVGRMVDGFLSGGKVQLQWSAAPVNWPKDWAKLLMNCVIIAADTLSRGGNVSVKTSAGGAAPGFLITATGQTPRLNDEVTRVLGGEPATPSDGRSIQSYLTYRLAKILHTELSLHAGEGTITLAAGEMVSPGDIR
ncbi:MAG TPA: histidine phosphotransferase family protein [Rhizomicrobium sp.]|nr:histidine phosphotransferase family protein [Rhizomicrobium sp.]